MKKVLSIGVLALLLAGLVGSAVRADMDGHKADCQKQWGHYPYQAKPSPTTLPYQPCPQPCLPYQGPGPAPRYYAPLPDGCYHGKPANFEDSCKCKLFEKLKSCGRNDCGPCK